MTKIALVALIAGIVGCSHAPPRVRCDRHLSPINPPALAGQGRSSVTPTTPHQEGRP